MLHFKTIAGENCFIDAKQIEAVEGIKYQDCRKWFLGSKVFLKGGGKIKLQDEPNEIRIAINFKIKGSNL